MILYSHYYSNGTGEIIIKPIEVEETTKTYRAVKGEILYCRKTIKKAELNTLISDYGLYMVSKEPSPLYFKDKVIGYYEEAYRRAVDNERIAVSNLGMAKVSTVRVEGAAE